MPNIIEPSEILDIVKELGTTAVLETVTKTYDQDTGGVTESSPGTETVYITPPEPYNQSMGEIDNILEGSLFTYVAAYGVTADIEASKGLDFTFNSQVFKIVSISPVFVSTDVGLYLLQVQN